jgi:hypothetical protein
VTGLPKVGASEKAGESLRGAPRVGGRPEETIELGNWEPAGGEVDLRRGKRGEPDVELETEVEGG